MTQHSNPPATAGSDTTGSSSRQPTPYVDALIRHRDRDLASFMVPGHGAGGADGGARLAEVFGANTVSLDIPQLLEGIDLGVDSPFSQSLTLAADAWGADRAWFLTGGASQGNRMALMGIRALGDVVVAQRSAHSSFFDGLILAGLTPRFVEPSIDGFHGIAHGVTAESVAVELAAAQAAGERVAGVYVVSPSYFGVVADVEAIAEVCHTAGVVLIVDNAWGPHFGFHPDLPESPVRLGADLTVASVHKLGGSFTQSAMLLSRHREGGVREGDLARAHRMTESTSPSSFLLASLDIARAELVGGTDRITQSLAAAERLRELVRSDEALHLAEEDFGEFPDIVGIDPLHVAIDVTWLGLSGMEARDRLAADYGIYVEIATQTCIVALMGAGSIPDVDRLVRALHALEQPGAADVRSGLVELRGSLPKPGRLVMSPREAYFAESEEVPAAEAVGRVADDLVAAYPPGIPNLLPGEEITAEAIEYLTTVAHTPGGWVRGAVDPKFTRVRVVKNS